MRNKKGLVYILLIWTILAFVVIPAAEVRAQVGGATGSWAANTGFEKICSRSSAGGLPQCIANLYLIALGLGAIVALLLLVIAGFRYMTASGNASNVEAAKESFTSALIGLLIIFMAFMLLYTINPALTRFTIPGFGPIQVQNASRGGG